MMMVFLMQILRQAKDNCTSVRVTGGTYPFTALPDDVVMDLRWVRARLGPPWETLLTPQL